MVVSTDPYRFVYIGNCGLFDMEKIEEPLVDQYTTSPYNRLSTAMKYKYYSIN